MPEPEAPKKKKPMPGSTTPVAMTRYGTSPRCRLSDESTSRMILPRTIRLKESIPPYLLAVRAR